MSEKPRVLLLNPTCLDVVDSHQDWLAQLPIDLDAKQSYRQITQPQLRLLMNEAEGIIFSHTAKRPIRAQWLGESSRLRVISLAASGYDGLDLNAATSAGIVVTNVTVPEGAEVVADMAWGLMLAVGRQILQHDRQIRAGNLQRGMGTTPWRKTLGIVGVGNIGRAVVRRAVGFEMQLLATEPYPDHDFVDKMGIELVELEELLARSDFVSLHMRLNDETKGLIEYEKLKRMKPSAFLINSARRDLVVEDDLDRALAENRLAGAGLDDPPLDLQSPLLKRENVVFTTHLGNRARVGVDAVFRCAVQNAVDVLTGGECSSIVNPDVLRQNRSTS